MARGFKSGSKCSLSNHRLVLICFPLEDLAKGSGLSYYLLFCLSV